MRGLWLLAPVLCIGCKDRPTSLEDGPLGSKIHFSAIHYAEGKKQPRQLVVTGSWVALDI
jgi:hypothetical protein